MKFGYTGGLTIRLVWALFLVGATAALVTVLLLGIDPHQYPGINAPRNGLAQLELMIALAVMWLLLGAPFLTTHEVGQHAVVLRQGVLFRAEIPFDAIEDVGYGAKRPIGLGVRWYPDMVFVVTWPDNLVALRLRRRHTFRLCGLVPLPPARTVVVNVDDPDAFLAALRARLDT